jgi:hypothetical protein
LQALDHVGTQCFNLMVGWSELDGALRLSIRFCTGSPGCVQISSFFKHVIRKASPKMGSQTRVRRIHEHRSSQTTQRSLLDPVGVIAESVPYPVNGILQSIFSAPSRRVAIRVLENLSRRAATLKMLCVKCSAFYA